MVLIDSNFKDISKDEYTLKQNHNNSGTYKIYGKCTSDYDITQKEKINKIKT